MDRRSLICTLAAAAAVPLAGEARAAATVAAGNLSNANATAEARALYRYLCLVSQRKKTLTGQQTSTWDGETGPELERIETVTGELPAIIGLDFIDPLTCNVTIDRAVGWYKNQGGIPTICWHWGNPLVGPGYDQSKIYFDIWDALKPGTRENVAMMADLDRIAGYLGDIQKQGVPVLWRPFHEFSGDWFWWGKGGPELFKKLWVKMYDYFTTEKKLNNLIWVLGYTGEPSEKYYPGRQYVDIVGADTYVKDHGSLKALYDRVVAIAGTDMPIPLHECGPIPDPDALTADGADWAYFMTWCYEFILDGKTNPDDFLKRAYTSDRYISLNEVPPFTQFS